MLYFEKFILIKLKINNRNLLSNNKETISILIKYSYSIHNSWVAIDQGYINDFEALSIIQKISSLMTLNKLNIALDKLSQYKVPS